MSKIEQIKTNVSPDSAERFVRVREDREPREMKFAPSLRAPRVSNGPVMTGGNGDATLLYALGVVRSESGLGLGIGVCILRNSQR